MDKNAKIYVAGHHGLVGSAIWKNLQEKGYTNLVGRTHKELDLLDGAAVKQFFDEEMPEYVFLAAAFVGGIMANSIYRADFIYKNLQIQQNVIGESFRHQVKKLLFLGSTCIYPRDAEQPMKEDVLLTSPLEYTNEPYAIAKIAGLKMCESFNLQYGTNYIAVMPTNLYGPNDNFDLERSHVLPAMIRKVHLAHCLKKGDWEAVRKDMNLRPVEGISGANSNEEILRILRKYGITETEVTLWGTGTPLREFLWSEEMADASVFVMEHVDFKDTYKAGAKDIRNCHINIGTGKEITIRELAGLIVNTVGYQGKLTFDSSKPDGTILGQKITPLHRVGVYVPGGKAVYPSSVLMNVMPAKVAGVDEIIMVTPPGKNGKVSPNTLVAAKEAGVNKIYKVGGAQAIAALAYGTESIPKVDKIVGPGNIYVALAKKAVYGHVSIDSIAGPSEILVVADETANPRYVAADLLSQAEHDELASAILVTTSEKLAHEVSDQVDGFLKELSRAEIISKSLDNYGYILLADTMEDVIDVANEIASEHLEIQTKNPFEVMTKIRNAGAIFIGEYASEPLGDYFAGPNHILPTNGTAKFFSPLSVDDFIKKSSIISYSREALQKVHKDIESFAKAEQLTAHANSIHVRFEEED